MKTPPQKKHVRGTYDIAFYVCEPTGTAIEFKSTKPIDINHPIAVAMRATIAALVNCSPEEIARDHGLERAGEFSDQHVLRKRPSRAKRK